MAVFTKLEKQEIEDFLKNYLPEIFETQNCLFKKIVWEKNFRTYKFAD